MKTGLKLSSSLVLKSLKSGQLTAAGTMFMVYMYKQQYILNVLIMFKDIYTGIALMLGLKLVLPVSFSSHIIKHRYFFQCIPRDHFFALLL